MAQWMNLHQNNTFVNWMRLPLLCETSGAILLVLVHGSYGKPSDKILVDLKFSTVHIIRIKVRCYYNAFQSVFRHVMEPRKSGMAYFLC